MTFFHCVLTINYRIFELWVEGGGGMANIFLNVILRNKSAPTQLTKHRIEKSNNKKFTYVLTLEIVTEHYICLFSLQQYSITCQTVLLEMLMSHYGAGMTVNCPFQVFSSNFQVNKP